MSQRTKVWLCYIITSGISAYIFIHYVIKNGNYVIDDEVLYWNLAKQIRVNGLFHFSNELRTYMYPFMISIITLFTGDNPHITKIIMSIAQYGLFIYTVYLVAKTASKYFNSKIVYYSTLFLGVTNPYLISACTLFLTDISAACLITISLITLLTCDLKKIKNALVIACLLYASVMIRPSNSIFMLLFFVVVLHRIIRERNLNIWKFVVVGILSLVIFVPQLYMNITKFHDFTPLIHMKLYTFQATEAVKYLKYGTVVIPNEKAQLFYVSPFQNHLDMTIYQLLFSHPLQFIVIFSAHIFSLFDWEYINVYIFNLSVLRKLIPSLYLFMQWFIIIIGIVYMIKKKDRTFAPTIFVAISYALFMGTTTVESRFGFPIYLILLPFIGIGIHKTIESLKNKKILSFGLYLVIFCLLMLYGSYLIDMQTGRMKWF